MKYNFASGPATLPKEVITQLTESIKDFDNTGLSILESYHRSDNFINILEQSKYLVKKMLNISNEYEVLFLHGGASLQFVMIPYNFLDYNDIAAFIDTGVWSQKAILQASKFGKTDIIASSKDKRYTYIPDNWSIDNNKYKYLYLCSNNSIYGTAWSNYPDVKIPLIADMTSDLLTKNIDISKFTLIYASLQKNLGIAGAAVVIIKKDFLYKYQVKKNIPDMLNFKVQIDSNSIYSTPPVVSIYVAYLMLNWMQGQGGIQFFEKENIKKANILYKQIDNSKIFFNDVNKRDRSNTNVIFKAKEKNLEEGFINFAAKHDCLGIKGHRSMGGFRVALYNAIDFSAVRHLVNIMDKYEKQL